MTDDPMLTTFSGEITFGFHVELPAYFTAQMVAEAVGSHLRELRHLEGGYVQAIGIQRDDDPAIAGARNINITPVTLPDIELELWGVRVSMDDDEEDVDPSA